MECQSHWIHTAGGLQERKAQSCVIRRRAMADRRARAQGPHSVVDTRLESCVPSWVSLGKSLSLSDPVFCAQWRS